ncbi:MAG: DUF4326 domain-containing protein [Micromonosporaceae bacterium]|nr:DUF4326 domain-containing protein [Micromonosporaceae bacterium]
MKEIPLTAVVFDESIYPRAEWSQTTVNRYVEALEAGDRFPPIILEDGTNRLLDGMHRARAHQQAGRETIEVEYHQIPTGVPPKVYAASLSAKHGDRISGEDLREIAREVARENPDFNLVTLAKYFGVTRQTVSRWVSDITERRREVRKVRALLLARAGWSMQQIANHLGVGKATAVEDVNSDISDRLSEDLLREAAEGLPIDAEAIVEEIRQERIFAQWTDEEREILKRLRDGETVVVSMRIHNNLIGWAETTGVYERIDRRTPWGNPFEMPDDGDRDTVITNYETHYLPHKPSLLARLGTLRGKALGCWCAPEPCHGDVLKRWAEQC